MTAGSGENETGISDPDTTPGTTMCATCFVHQGR